MIVPFSNYKFEEHRGDAEANLEHPSTPVDEKGELKGELSHEENNHVNRY